MSMAKLGIILLHIFRMNGNQHGSAVLMSLWCWVGIDKSELNCRLCLLLHNRNRILSSIEIHRLIVQMLPASSLLRSIFIAAPRITTVGS